MNLERDIFKRTTVLFDQLEPYGFHKQEKGYSYEVTFLNDEFKAVIFIDFNGNITGKVYDQETEEEYTNIHVLTQTGAFVSKVREVYEQILTDIRNHCFEKNCFISPQANRITKWIDTTYHDEPEFLWEKYPGYGVFRHQNNEKWYGAIMNIDYSKLDSKKTGEVEIMDLKLEEEKINHLLKEKGFYPAYHMNKKNWITVLLDESLSDEKIISLLEESYRDTGRPNEWLIPANPKYYDLIEAFKQSDMITWKQSNEVHVDDLIYIYVAEPYSAILYQCRAVKVNIPYEYQDENVAMKYTMELQLINTYTKDQYPLSMLKEYGVKAVRGPRRVPDKLRKVLEKTDV